LTFIVFLDPPDFGGATKCFHVQHFLGICIILMVFSKYTVPGEHLEWDKQCHGWFQMIIVTDSPFIKEAELLPLETR
jgi:hypothetical protein